MSKSTKKLVSWIVCLTMAVSSISMMAFAADDTDTSTTETVETTTSTEETADEAEAETEATEEEASEDETEDAEEADDETEATEDEEEETSTSSSYDSDEYYQKALTLCTSLGIIEGYEDGSVQPDSTVTRAQMAAIVLRMLNISQTSSYSNSFNDMTSDHWAADTVQTAAEQGIVNGMGDGSFNPDGDVLYEQAVKMIVCALGYEVNALINGSYPTGYLRQAEALELTDHAAGATGVAIDRGTIIKMVYNALLTDYNTATSTDTYGNTIYTADKTLGEAKFDLIEDEGVLMATSSRYISASYSNLLDGQIAIDGTIYETDLTNLDEYVGMEVTYYYQQTSLSTNVIAVTSSGTKSSTLTLTSDQIKEMSGFEEDTGLIEMEKGEGANKKCTDAIVVYNGEIITLADYNKAAEDDPDRFYEVDENGEAISSDVMSYSDFLCPKVGTIELIDSDNDNIYDYVFVSSYETLLVTSATSKKVAGKINNSTVTIDVDTSANAELTVSVTKSDTAATARNLSKNDVVSLLRTLDNETITMVVTGESIVGSATSVEAVDNVWYAVINGEEYEVDANAADDLKVGVSSTYYLDIMGRIGYIETSSGGKLSGSQQYGVVMSTYLSDDGSDYMVKMYTSNGTAEEYKFASTVTFWGGNSTEAVSLKGSARSTLGDLTTKGLDIVTNSSGTQIRLCKYKLNSNGEVSQLYMAADVDAIGEDSDGLAIDTQNYNGTLATKGLMLGGHQIKDGGTGFTAPKDSADMSSASNYTTFSVTSSAYLNAENGVSKDFVIGEFSDGYATVVFELTSSSTAAAALTDYDTAGDNNCMVVTRINVGVNDDDEDIYIIRGIRSGSDVSITTSASTALYKMNSYNPMDTHNG
ncbi:MAG: S-layer homology domain-containing protein, partial [Firmicutes bacterium]|nr:S-layer homology domain-containing protein [Bacillota bacterium]